MIVTERKMSEIFKEMAFTILKNPRALPSSEAMHAGLLVAHVAWNRELGESFPDEQYEAVLKEFSKSRPSMWKEFSTRNTRLMIEKLRVYKRINYPDDSRIVIICGMRESGVIHIEWVRASDKPKFDHMMSTAEEVFAGKSMGLPN